MSRDPKIKFFQETLLRWFITNGRHHLPWRQKGLTAYQIIFAEMLLQRTKAETVEKHYLYLLTVFPDWHTIIKKGLPILQQELKPIGLHQQKSKRIFSLAEEMVRRNQILHNDESALQQLPMFGQYIVNAILLQIYNVSKPLLDVNMARVLERFFGERKLADIRYDPFLQKLANEVVNHKNTLELNWAILDFARKICVPRKPHCLICPLAMVCLYAQSKQSDITTID